MADEAEGTQLQLKVPDHHGRVGAARDELLHVRVEGDGGDRIAVPAEGALEQKGRRGSPCFFVGWRETRLDHRPSHTARAGPCARCRALAADSGARLLWAPQVPRPPRRRHSPPRPSSRGNKIRSRRKRSPRPRPPPNPTTA